MASSRTIVLAATGVAAVAAAAVIGASAGTQHADRDARSATRSSVTGSPTAGASRGAGAPGSDGPAGTGGSAAGPGTGSGSGDGGASPASELLPTPAGPSGAATGYALPHPTGTPAPLLGSDLPAAGAAKGRLVAGFPAALAPPRGARVESTSVAVAGRVVQAALVATGGDPQRILRHYREELSVRGFVERPTQGVENSPAAAFSKGADHVTISTRDGRTYLLADLRATGAQG